MKAYTDLNQSKKLAKILPLESADMYYDVDSYGIQTTPEVLITSVVRKKDTPCWSLAALLEVLPKQIGRYTKTLYWFDDAWHCEYVDEDSESKYGVTADNSVDACVVMIKKLHKQNLI